MVETANRALQVVETLSLAFVVLGVIPVVAREEISWPSRQWSSVWFRSPPRSCAGTSLRADVDSSCGRTFGRWKATTVKGSDDDLAH